MEDPMKLNLKTISIYSCALTFAAALAVAQQTPTVISPTAGSAPNGIAPNGIAATPTTGVLFTQPFEGSLQSRGAYAITIPGGVVSTDFPIPTNGVTTGTENGIANVPTPALSGFTSGDVYATGASAAFPGNDAIYKNGALFVDDIPDYLSQLHTSLAFDSVGSFNGDLFVTADRQIFLYNSSGTLVATYNGPAGYVSGVDGVSDQLLRLECLGKRLRFIATLGVGLLMPPRSAADENPPQQRDNVVDAWSTYPAGPWWQTYNGPAGYAPGIDGVSDQLSCLSRMH